MLTQDMIVDIFLCYPTEELLLHINDKDMALKLLSSLPDCLLRNLFFWQRDKDKSTEARINLIKMSLKEGNRSLFFYLVDGIDLSVISNSLILLAAFHGREKEVRYLMPRNPSFHIGSYAVKGDHRSIVMDMIKRGSSKYNNIAESAAEGGHDDLVMEMISLGADSYCSIAAKATNIELVNTMIEKRIEYGRVINSNFWNTIAMGTARRGYSDIARAMIETHVKDAIVIGGANNWNDIAAGAALNDDRKLLYEMIDMGANDWGYIARNAISSDIVIDMINRGYKDYSDIAEYAVIKGHRDVYDLVIDKVSQIYIDRVASHTVQNNSKEMLLDLIKRGANKWEELLTISASRGYKELFLIIQKEQERSFFTFYCID